MIVLVELVLVLQEVVALDFVVWMVRAKPLVHHVRESLFIVHTCTHTLLLDEAPTVKRNKILSKIFIETCYFNHSLGLRKICTLGIGGTTLLANYIT